MKLPTVADVERLLPSDGDFDQRLRGPRTAARVGAVLGLTFGICFLTGVWSHVQYDPPTWLPLTSMPSWTYRVTQGTHIASGVASIPLLLVKLWSVYPRLFARPDLSSLRGMLLEVFERGSIAVLVGAGVFQLVSGSLNIVQWYPWGFSFRSTHYAVAWVAIGSLLVHVGVKLPLIRDAFAVPADDADQPARDGMTRRTVVRTAFGASAVAVLLTVGETVPWLRRVSVFGPRDGQGPQSLPINRTARAAGATKAALDPDFRLEIVSGATTVTLTRDDLARMPQRSHELPIACVEGWSRNAHWTGVAMRDLVALVGADPHSDVTVHSMQTRGAFASTHLPADFVADHRTLLALELNGETLAVDHGYPCRIIAPNRPGVLQTKWVRQLVVHA